MLLDTYDMNETNSFYIFLLFQVGIIPYVYNIFHYRSVINRFISLLPVLYTSYVLSTRLFADVEYGGPVRYLFAGIIFGAMTRACIFLFCIDNEYREKLLKLNIIDWLWNHLLAVRSSHSLQQFNENYAWYTTPIGRMLQLIVKLLILHYIILPWLHYYDNIKLHSLYNIQSFDDYILLLRYSSIFSMFLYYFLDASSEIAILLLQCITLCQCSIYVPLYDYMLQPLYRSTSIMRFWNRGWHVFLKETFKGISYRPIKYYTQSTTLAVISVFIFSGLLHEYPYYISTHIFSGAYILFFTINGLLCVIECYITATYKQYNMYITPSIGRILTLLIVINLSTIIFGPFAEINWQYQLPLDVIQFGKALIRPFIML